MNLLLNISFDVVITTYNRKKNVTALVNSILQLEVKPTRIIVIDSSDEVNEDLVKMNGVDYIVSNKSHQNQPYKRLVGAYASNAENIIFFDDDIEIIDNAIFEKLLPLFKIDKVIAFTSNIDFQNFAESNKLQKLLKYVLFLTGKPIMKSGRMGMAGYYGSTSKSGTTQVEVLKGPLMGFNREMFLKLPSNRFLDLFDLQLAIPEDKILAIRSWKYGTILNYPDNLVRHPKIESTYFKNIRNHTMRVVFSRYVINQELSVYRSKNLGFLYKFHFWYYYLWRLFVSIIRLIRLNANSKNRFLGMIDAAVCALKFDLGYYCLNTDYHILAKEDSLKRANA